MGNKPLLVIFSLLGLSGLAFADTGFRDLIQVTETDGSPKCMAGQLKFQPGQVACSGNTATMNIVGGGGGASSLAVTVGVNRSSPTSDIMFNPAQFSGSISGSTITISSIGGSGGVTVYPATATASFPYGITSATVTLTDSIFFNGVKTIAMDSSNNNFIGYAAGGLMQSGVNNVFLGDFAGFYHQSGDQNLYIGNQSGSDGVHRGTGHDNIYIGANTWSKNNSDSYCTAIGFGATCPHSNAVKIGGEDANSQMVYMSSMTVSSATVTGLSIGGLVNQACIGTSANGTVQTGTCGGSGGGGYAVEPATVTFNLAKGFQGSTGTLTGADGLTVTYGVTAGSFTTTGTGAGSVTMTEGSAPSGVASKSVIWADATAHWPKFIPNNGQAYRFVGSSATASAGNCAKFTADGSIVDAGAACGTGVSSGGGFAMQPTTATINISSGMVLSGSAGTSGQFLKSNGPGTVPTWQSAAGSGDAVLANSQVWIGTNTFYGGTTFYGEVTMMNKSTVTYENVLVEVSTLSLVYQIRWANGSIQTSSPTAGGSSNNDGSFGMTFDGGGTALSASATSYVEIPFSGTITGWTIYSDVSGSANISVYKDTYANFPPTVADIINGTETPLLSTAQKNQDLTLSSWTTAVTKGDIVAFVLNSASTLTRVTVTVRVTKS